jgi:hypothetical protein
VDYPHTVFESFLLSGIGFLIFIAFGSDHSIFRQWAKVSSLFLLIIILVIILLQFYYYYFKYIFPILFYEEEECAKKNKNGARKNAEHRKSLFYYYKLNSCTFTKVDRFSMSFPLRYQPVHKSFFRGFYVGKLYEPQCIEKLGALGPN